MSGYSPEATSLTRSGRIGANTAGERGKQAELSRSMSLKTMKGDEQYLNRPNCGTLWSGGGGRRKEDEVKSYLHCWTWQMSNSPIRTEGASIAARLAPSQKVDPATTYFHSYQEDEMEFVNEPARGTPVVREADIVVVGGGPAGIGAALRAARAGADVIVIEKCGNLGGANVSGWCRVLGWGEHIAGEIWETLEARGYAAKVLDLLPELLLNPLFHYNANPTVDIEKDQLARGLYTFDADMAACVINEMIEEAGVELMFRSLFVGAQVEGGNIKAVFVENASGRQAIRGKVFTDTTGNADVVARVGAPYTKAGNEFGVPICMGLMWKMIGVDYQRLFEYQKSDPRLYKLIDQARENGELPYYRPKKTDIGLRPQSSDLQYSGHPHPEIAPTVHARRGEVELWMPSMYEWALDGADNADDVTRAEIHIRKQILSELNFLKKYVPGFEHADLSGISPYLGIRESRHPVGEYVLTIDDVVSGRQFDDVALARGKRPGWRREFPYRCFLPKTIDNLLVAGDDICADHYAAFLSHSFNTSINLGEVAGIAAALSVDNGVTPKQLAYPILKCELVRQGILVE